MTKLDYQTTCSKSQANMSGEMLMNEIENEEDYE